MSGDSLKLREIILNTRTPIVLKNFNTNWKFNDGSLEDWCKLFDDSCKDDKMEFEQMEIKSSTRHPQWERERKIVKSTMKEFLQLHQNQNQDFWTGLNYKTPDDIPNACKANIDFSCFGFPYLTNDYARFWLSSKGANTPCHQDTYGCNIVVQVYGSKSWLLFPPNTKLTPTRLPYEESSIYCLENFYAPAPLDQLPDLRRFNTESYIFQLNVGDVLIVPRYWWHFVETIETSLSINAWIPLEVDVEAQFHECIVKYLIESLVRQENSDNIKYFLNPNQLELSSEQEILGILDFLSKKVESPADSIDMECIKKSEVSYPYQYLGDEAVELLLNEFPNGSFVKRSSEQEYESLLNRNASRFIAEDSVVHESPIRDIKETLINSICCMKILKEISREFQERYNKKKGHHHKGS